MRYKDLSLEDKQYLTHFYYDDDMSHQEKMDILVDKFDTSERSIRRWWREELKLSQTYDKLPPQLRKAQNKNIPRNTDILLITAAQNKTGINIPFLNNLKAYRKYLIDLGYNTEIIVAPAKYRNPTSPSEYRANKGEVEEWWRDEVLEYLHYGKLQFGDTLISTNSHIRPTAKKPMTGYEVLAKDNNLILPHPRIHFKTMPRFKNGPLRTMSTTGFITKKNYSDSKAGETAFEHHSYGFVIVEKKKNGVCHIPRNVKVTSDGSFIDLTNKVKDGEVYKIENTKGLIWGDLHASEVNKEVFDRTLDLYDAFKPEITVIHDALDASTANPHEVKDMFIQRLKIIEKRNSIEDEIEHCFDLLSEIVDTGTKLNVVVSNHDIFLDRLINDGNWKRDLHNSPMYLKMALIQQTVDLRKYGSIFGYMLNQKFEGKVNYLNFGDSLDIGNYECALHGDFGTNGARGGAASFSKLNTKMIGGHSHSPVIVDGYNCVGVTANLNQYYTRKGLSSWAHAHMLVHDNDKSQMLVFGDDYRFTELV